MQLRPEHVTQDRCRRGPSRCPMHHALDSSTVIRDVDAADAVARHDHKHGTVDERYVTDRWLDQHGYSCRPRCWRRRTRSCRCVGFLGAAQHHKGGPDTASRRAEQAERRVEHRLELWPTSQQRTGRTRSASACRPGPPRGSGQMAYRRRRRARADGMAAPNPRVTRGVCRGTAHSAARRVRPAARCTTGVLPTDHSMGDRRLSDDEPVRYT